MNAPLDEQRRAELVASLGALRARIADACHAAGRDPHAVTLVAVTKTYPAGDVAILAGIGVLDIGENRDQEAAAKAAAVDELLTGTPAERRPRWHFIGQLQTRKCRSVATYAHAVHSLDRLELVDRLADAVTRAERAPLGVFVQLSLDGDPHRGGVLPADLAALADAVAGRPELRLRGLMAVAPLGADPDAAFADLQAASMRLRESHPDAVEISAGMSEDLEAALRHGSTHIRVGSALLGRRSPLIG